MRVSLANSLIVRKYSGEVKFNHDMSGEAFSPRALPFKNTSSKKAAENYFTQKDAREAIKSTAPYLSWQKLYANREAAINSLRVKDYKLFDLILYNLSDEDRKILSNDRVFKKQVRAAISELIVGDFDGSKLRNYRNASRIALSALENGINYEIKSEKRLQTDFLIEAMLRLNQSTNALLLANAMQANNLSLNSTTILNVIRLNGEISNLRGIECLARFSIEVLAKGLLSSDDNRVAKVFDVLTAKLGHPSVLRETRFRQYYGDKSMKDISDRLLLAAKVGLALSNAGIEFKRDKDMDRLNMLVRSLVTVSNGITEGIIKLNTPGNFSFHRTVGRFLETDFQYPEFGLVEARKHNLAGQSQLLLGSALELVDEMLEYRANPWSDEPEVFQKNRIQGSTVNHLVKGIFFAGLKVDGFTAYQIGSVLTKSLKEPEVCKKLHTRYLSLALISLVESDSTIAHYEAVRVLDLALRSGKGFSKDIIQKVYDKAKVSVRPIRRLKGNTDSLIAEELESGSKLYSDLIQKVDLEGMKALEKLHKILYKPAKNRQPVSFSLPAIDDKDLNGGLGSLPPAYLRKWRLLSELSAA